MPKATATHPVGLDGVTALWARDFSLAHSAERAGLAQQRFDVNVSRQDYCVNDVNDTV